MRVPHPKGPSTLLGIGLVGGDVPFGYLDPQKEGFAVVGCFLTPRPCAKVLPESTKGEPRVLRGEPTRVKDKWIVRKSLIVWPDPKPYGGSVHLAGVYYHPPGPLSPKP